MNKDEYIIQYCPNFYRIINFNYKEEDDITKRLINIYKKCVFTIEPTTREELNELRQLDYVLSKYIDDSEFRESLQLHISHIDLKTKKDIIKAFINGLMDIYNSYLEGTTKKIHIARWI